MDLPPAWSGECMCGRTFSSPSGYTNHQRSCSKMKKRLSSCLEKARDALSQAKKRHKTGVVPPEATARSHIAEGARQTESREPLISQGVERTGDTHSLAVVPMKDVYLPGQQQVMFYILKLSLLFMLPSYLFI